MQRKSTDTGNGHRERTQGTGIARERRNLLRHKLALLPASQVVTFELPVFASDQALGAPTLGYPRPT